MNPLLVDIPSNVVYARKDAGSLQRLGRVLKRMCAINYDRDGNKSKPTNYVFEGGSEFTCQRWLVVQKSKTIFWRDSRSSECEIFAQFQMGIHKIEMGWDGMRLTHVSQGGDAAGTMYLGMWDCI